MSSYDLAIRNMELRGEKGSFSLVAGSFKSIVYRSQKSKNRLICD
jgi:hypothetical protein